MFLCYYYTRTVRDCQVPLSETAEGLLVFDTDIAVAGLGDGNVPVDRVRFSVQGPGRVGKPGKVIQGDVVEAC